MSKVDWSKAPEEAQFYSFGKFRKIIDSCEFYWCTEENQWEEASFESLDWHKLRSDDFEMRPKEHPHAALKALYAIDAQHSDTPWEFLEMSSGGDVWVDCVSDGSLWAKSNQYRRKLDAPVWSDEPAQLVFYTNETLTTECDVERPTNKYAMSIKGVEFDVYDVLKAAGVACPARQHAIKKLLKGGQRGYKDERQDLKEARDSITRSIELLD